ncbi:MAG: SRPBCC domain-containing protein [Nannocystaceae bacterium]
MKTFSSTITIHAPAATIWALLTDAPAYPEWNPTVERVEGTIALGAKIKVFAAVSPGRAFPVKVAELVPGERMVWSSGMPLGLFKGERTFTLTPRGDGVEFSMREVFSGLMSPLIERSIPDLQPAFDAFAGALKREAEATDSRRPA